MKSALPGPHKLSGPGGFPGGISGHCNKEKGMGRW